MSMEPRGRKNRQSGAGRKLGRVIRLYSEDQSVGTLEE
jgi:hypothetical protein